MKLIFQIQGQLQIQQALVAIAFKHIRTADRTATRPAALHSYKKLYLYSYGMHRHCSYRLWLNITAVTHPVKKHHTLHQLQYYKIRHTAPVAVLYWKARARCKQICSTRMHQEQQWSICSTERYPAQSKVQVTCDKGACSNATVSIKTQQFERVTWTVLCCRAWRMHKDIHQFAVNR